MSADGGGAEWSLGTGDTQRSEAAQWRLRTEDAVEAMLHEYTTLCESGGHDDVEGILHIVDQYNKWRGAVDSLLAELNTAFMGEMSKCMLQADERRARAPGAASKQAESNCSGGVSTGVSGRTHSAAESASGGAPVSDSPESFVRVSHADIDADDWGEAKPDRRLLTLPFEQLGAAKASRLRHKKSGTVDSAQKSSSAEHPASASVAMSSALDCVDAGPVQTARGSQSHSAVCRVVRLQRPLVPEPVATKAETPVAHTRGTGDVLPSAVAAAASAAPVNASAGRGRGRGRPSVLRASPTPLAYRPVLTPTAQQCGPTKPRECRSGASSDLIVLSESSTAKDSGKEEEENDAASLPSSELLACACGPPSPATPEFSTPPNIESELEPIRASGDCLTDGDVFSGRSSEICKWMQSGQGDMSACTPSPDSDAAVPMTTEHCESLMDMIAGRTFKDIFVISSVKMPTARHYPKVPCELCRHVSPLEFSAVPLGSVELRARIETALARRFDSGHSDGFDSSALCERDIVVLAHCPDDSSASRASVDKSTVSYRRARVDILGADTAHCHLMDYGNTVDVRLDDIVAVLSDDQLAHDDGLFASAPVAFDCCLYGADARYMDSDAMSKWNWAMDKCGANGTQHLLVQSYRGKRKTYESRRRWVVRLYYECSQENPYPKLRGESAAAVAAGAGPSARMRSEPVPLLADDYCRPPDYNMGESSSSSGRSAGSAPPPHNLAVAHNTLACRERTTPSDEHSASPSVGEPSERDAECDEALVW